MFFGSNSNMTSLKRFGSKAVVKYAYIGISADWQRHNLLWLFKYRIVPIRIEIIQCKNTDNFVYFVLIKKLKQ